MSTIAACIQRNQIILRPAVNAHPCWGSQVDEATPKICCQGIQKWRFSRGFWGEKGISIDISFCHLLLRFNNLQAQSHFLYNLIPLLRDHVVGESLNKEVKFPKDIVRGCASQSLLKCCLFWIRRRCLHWIWQLNPGALFWAVALVQPSFYRHSPPWSQMRGRRQRGSLRHTPETAIVVKRTCYFWFPGYFCFRSYFWYFQNS